MSSAKAAVPPPDLQSTSESHQHFVQFYDDDAYLCSAVAKYLGPALAAGDAAVVIATPEHVRGFEEQLKAQAIDLAKAKRNGRYAVCDASETLDRLLVENWPDRARFRHEIGQVLEKAGAAARSRDRNVAAFGEMVMLLWRAGRRDAAIRLEQLWNELSSQYRFTLCCAYPMHGFGDATDSDAFCRVCDQHSAVLPAEQYAHDVEHDQRMRMIALLQQRSQALENEIRRRAAAEQDLAAREAELRDYLENAVTGMHWVAEDGTILWANDAEMAMLGYQAEDFIGRNIAEFHYDEAAVRDILLRLQSGETLRAYEARLRHKDGSIRHVLIDSNVLTKGGKFLHTRCFTLDITERKRTEEQLRLNQEWLRLAQSVAGIGFWEMDPLDETLIISQETGEMLGFSRGVEVISLKDFLAPIYVSGDRARVRTTLMKAARVNKEFSAEFRVRCRDGSSRVLATRGKSFFNGGSHRLMGVLIDVTPARALSAA